MTPDKIGALYKNKTFQFHPFSSPSCMYDPDPHLSTQLSHLSDSLVTNTHPCMAHPWFWFQLTLLSLLFTLALYLYALVFVSSQFRHLTDSWTFINRGKKNSSSGLQQQQYRLLILYQQTSCAKQLGAFLGPTASRTRTHAGKEQNTLCGLRSRQLQPM